MFLMSTRSYLMIMFMLFGVILSFSGGCASLNNSIHCKSDNDCLQAQRCEKETATCIKSRNVCSVNASTCQTDFECRTGRCYSKDCMSSSDCETGKKCNPVTKKCEIKPVGECDLGSCSSNQRCNPVTKKCEIKPVGECDLGSCSSNQRCNPVTKKCEIKPVGNCISDDDCVVPNGSCRQGKCQSCATRRTNCPKGLQCIKRTGRCEILECRLDKDCLASECCNTTLKRCEPRPTGCRSDSNCQAGEKCNTVTSKCEKKQVAGCKSDSDCFRGQRCNLTTKQCEAKPVGSCISDKDCAAPSGSCQSGKCKSCASQFNCRKGLQCVQGTGLCQIPKCKVNGDCAAPNGTCASGVCKSCVGLTCPTGQTCNKSTGACERKGGSGGKCLFSWDCKRDEYCSIPICKKKECGTGVSAKCPAGKYCFKSRCLIGCSSNSHCKATEYCSRNKCLIGCRSNSSCKTTESCSNHKCIAKECGVSGKKCTLGKICRSYGCVAPTRRTCTSRCSGGDTCLNIGASSSHCYKTCQTPGKSCSDGSDCIRIALQDGKSANFCFFLPSRKKGESCDLIDRRCVGGGRCLMNSPKDRTGECFASCKVGSTTTCTSTEVCHEYASNQGGCLPKGARKTGESCEMTTSRCDEKNHCEFTSSTTIGKCVLRCAALGTKSTCTGTSTCTKIGSTTRYGICSPIKTQKVGESCKGKPTSCLKGLTCVGTSSSTANCLKNCKLSSDCRSGTGSSIYRICRSLQSGHGSVCYVR